MVERSVIESDLSGKPASRAFFGLGGTWYEIDLTPEETEKLEQALEPYLKVGRKATSKPVKKRVVHETTTEEREEIRKWAKEAGFKMAERGRIPKAIKRAYDEAQGKEPEGDLGVDAAAIRKWAKEAGFELAELGRIPKRIQKAYDEAHRVNQSE